MFGKKPEKPKMVEKPVPEPVVKEPVKEVKEEVETTEEASESVWSVEDIPTATTPVIYNSVTKTQLSLYEAVAEILNRTEE